MTTRGSINWPQAALLSAFDDTLCRIAALSFFIDVRTVKIGRASPTIQLDIPVSETYIDLCAQVNDASTLSHTGKTLVRSSLTFSLKLPYRISISITSIGAHHGIPLRYVGAHRGGQGVRSYWLAGASENVNSHVLTSFSREIPGLRQAVGRYHLEKSVKYNQIMLYPTNMAECTRSGPILYVRSRS